MEIERKYLIKEIPFSLEAYPYKELEQGYISTSPVIRIRKADEQYILTVKSSGLLERQEFELPMNETDYKRLLGKVDGNLVTKRRYALPVKRRLHKRQQSDRIPRYANACRLRNLSGCRR